MVMDFDSWLTKLIEYCDLDIDRSFYQQLLQENESKKPKEEDINKHNRKGVPGDYINKLKPETIRKLDQKLEPILKLYHYQ